MHFMRVDPVGVGGRFWRLCLRACQSLSRSYRRFKPRRGTVAFSLAGQPAQFAQVPKAALQKTPKHRAAVC